MAGRRVVATALVGLILRAWFNGAARSLGSRVAATVLVGLLGAVLVAWVVGGSRALAGQIVLTPETAAYLVEPLTAILFSLPALASLFVTIYSVGRTAINDMTAVLPIGRADRVGVTRWLAAGLGTVVGAVWATPLTLQFLTALPPLAGVSAAVGCIAIAVLGAVLAQLCFSVIEIALAWTTGWGERATGAVAGAATALVLVWTCLLALPVGGRVDSDGPMTVVAAPLLWAAQDGGAAGLVAPFVLVAACVLAAFAVAVVDGLPRRRLLRLRPRRRRDVPVAGLVDLELRQWLRFPMNATFLLFTGVLATTTIAVWGRSATADRWYEIAYVFLALVSTVGIGAFGPTRSAHWVQAVAGRPTAWVGPKLVAVVALWLGSVLVLCTAFALFTPWRPADLGSILPTLLLELVAGCVVGLVLPVSREQSLSAAMSEGVAVLIVFSVTLGYQSLPWVGSQAGYLISHAVGIGMLLVLYVALARASTRSTVLAGR